MRLLLRDALFVRVGQGQFASVRSEAVRAIAARYTEHALTAALALTAQAEREIQFNANFAQAALALALRIRRENEV